MLSTVTRTGGISREIGARNKPISITHRKMVSRRREEVEGYVFRTSDLRFNPFNTRFNISAAVFGSNVLICG